MDKSEKRFERDIESFLISPEGGYTQFCGQDAEGNWVHTRQHDVSKCIYMDVLCEFIAKTQPKEWAKYTKYYGASAADKLYHRLETTISNQGLLYVLRNGIEDMGCKLKVCFFKPESNLNPLAIELYEANILGCARQFRYTTANTNTIDMVLSVNGIPVVALELKNQLTGQDYVCAINQFKHDRSSKEFAFRLNHRFLVYFAVDLYEAWMTTRLADGGTRFLPFNQGSNGAGVTGGAGNPQNPNGYATSYLWEEVLQRDSLLDLIHRFISFVKEKEEVVKNGVTKTVTKEKMIFPRYHQYDVVRKIMADVRENGVGTNYLIQHSAGSGKSNSIAWIAYRLASVHDVENNGLFDSVIVVTNRVVLDSQLQDTINSFEHQVGLVEAIDDNLKCFALNERCTQVDGYPVRRGMCFPIDKNTMYLFTHGIAPSVISPNRRYFQGGKSVPLPLKVVKHYGSGDMAQIATEILGLSKMNWNSFGLYSKLPCTIESSNEIARIGWLLSQFEGTLYDYRYFM